MLVTPLRDGMNLVAKEYVASRVDDDGVLVLSEFAGAADELQEAVSVNPYDVDGLTAAMRQALEMPPAERQRADARHAAARHHLRRAPVGEPFRARAVGAERRPSTAPMPETTLRETVARLRGASPLAILLDYDGTLVPIARTPDEAHAGRRADATDRGAGSSGPKTMVLMVSGRARDTLESWFGHLPIELWAEHGVWHRPAGATTWQTALTVRAATGWTTCGR